MADGKWIPSLRADTPLTLAARVALRARLEVVRTSLGLTLCEPWSDPEHVHKLRVGCRRAVATLKLFSQFLPGRTYRAGRRGLRQLRRTAGVARDWDVFLQTLSARRGRSTKGNFLFAYALGQRVAAQGILESAAGEFPDGFEPFAQEIVALVDEPETRSGLTLVDLGRPVLAELLADLQRSLNRSNGNLDHLHQVRIVGKRLRYSMEIFGYCFPAPFRERVYPTVETLQEILGRVNDSRVAIHNLQMLLERLHASAIPGQKRNEKEVNEFLRFHQRRLPREVGRFQKWCKSWDAGGTERLAVSCLRGTGRETP